MVVPLWVGCIDPSATPMGLHVFPRRDLHPLLHDPAADLMTATQYALGGLQKVGVGAILPPLQANLCPIGVAFLQQVPQRFQGTQLMSHRRRAPSSFGGGQATWGASCGGNETQCKRACQQQHKSRLTVAQERANQAAQGQANQAA